jgi:hypothetical protein
LQLSLQLHLLQSLLSLQLLLSLSLLPSLQLQLQLRSQLRLSLLLPALLFVIPQRSGGICGCFSLTKKSTRDGLLGNNPVQKKKGPGIFAWPSSFKKIADR